MYLLIANEYREKPISRASGEKFRSRANVRPKHINSRFQTLLFSYKQTNIKTLVKSKVNVSGVEGAMYVMLHTHLIPGFDSENVTFRIKSMQVIVHMRDIWGFSH